MTYAPKRLLELRDYAIRDLGAPPKGVGIVGDTVHQGGYHLGWDRLKKFKGWSDYSAKRARDRAALRGPTADAACAFDLSANSRDHRRWLGALVRDLIAGQEYTRGIRAVNGSLDGHKAWRWDREYGFKPTDDRLQHVGHSHLEFYRDVIASGVPLLPVLIRPLQERRTVRRKAPGGTNLSIKTLNDGTRPWWQLVWQFYAEPLPNDEHSLRVLGAELRRANSHRGKEPGSGKWETVPPLTTITVPPVLHY